MASVEEIIPLLEKVSLFQGLPLPDLERIAGIGAERALPAGETLFEEGEAGDAFFAIASGAVEILRRRPDGSSERLAIRRAGEAFGEMALLDSAPRSATARTTEPTRLLVWSRNDFRGLLDPNSPAFRMLTSLSRALRALDVRFTAQEKGVKAGEAIARFNAVLRQALLPRVVPSADGYEIAAGTSMVEGGAADTAWDTIRFSDGEIGLVTFQVLGEGLPPAHHLGVARGVLRALARKTMGAEGLLSDANEALASVAIEGMSQVVECTLLVPRPKALVWAGAGRSPALLVRANGSAEDLPAAGPPLGMMAGFQYGARSLELAKGDVVAVISRGSSGVLKGAGDLIKSLAAKPVTEIASTLHQALARANPPGTETSIVLARRTG